MKWGFLIFKLSDLYKYTLFYYRDILFSNREMEAFSLV